MQASFLGRERKCHHSHCQRRNRLRAHDLARAPSYLCQQGPEPRVSSVLLPGATVSLMLGAAVRKECSQGGAGEVRDVLARTRGLESRG